MSEANRPPGWPRGVAGRPGDPACAAGLCGGALAICLLLAACPEASSPLEPELRIVTGALPPGEVEVGYAARVEAEGVVGAARWRVLDGELPPGLALDGDRAAEIRGTPNVAGDFAFTLRVEDERGEAAEGAFSIAIAPGALQIRSPARLEGPVDAPFAARFAASGGRPPYSWRLEGAAPGLSLEPEGADAALAGTPTQVGVFEVTLEVTDAAAQVATATATVEIFGALGIAGPAVGSATVGVAYEAAFGATPGAGAHAWSAEGLPGGLRLEPGGATARLVGAPTSTGAFAVTIAVRDRLAQTASAALELVVSAPLELAPDHLPEVVLGDEYDASVRAVGGRSPRTIALVQGSLPPGIVFTPGADGAVRLFGTAGREGAFPLTFEARDPDGRRARGSLVLTVQPSGEPLVITPSPPPVPSEACRAIAAYLFTDGGARFGQRWTVQTPLPDGLRLGTVYATYTTIGGVPTTPGEYNVRVEVEDSNRERAAYVQRFEIGPSTSGRWAAVGGVRDAAGRPAVGLVDLCRPEPALVQAIGGLEVDFEMSEDGRWLAVRTTQTSSTATLELWDLRADPPARFEPDPAQADFTADLYFGPAGERLDYVTVRHVAGGVQHVLRRIDLSGPTPGAPILLHAPAVGEAHRIRAVSPDGRWIAFGRSFDELRLLSVEGGQTWLMAGDARPVGFDASSRWLVYREEDDLQRTLARAWRVGGEGPAVEFLPPRILHDIFLVAGGRYAVLAQAPGNPAPWRAFTFGEDQLVEQGSLPGTDVCGAPVGLADRPILWCPSSRGTTFVDLEGGLGLFTVAGPTSGLFALSPRGNRAALEVELDPALGPRLQIFRMNAPPGGFEPSLTPQAPVGVVGDVAFGGGRLLLFGRRGQLSSAHDPYAFLWREITEVWRGQAQPYTSDPPFRTDGSGAFVSVVGSLRWLDLSVPGEGRVVPVSLPPGVTVTGGAGPNRVLVQPDP